MTHKTIRKSKEDYLEAVLVTIRKDGACRVTDVAREIGFSKASTSVALRKLEEDGFIERDDWRVLLTEEGQAIAERVYERHNFFRKWFEEMGIAPDVAAEDACQIEHVISDETYAKIKEFIRGSH